MSTGSESTGHALADTSVFIGLENARFDEGEMPASVSVSVITIAELRLGVLIASSVSDRARRMATLRLAESLEPLPIDDAAANAWATLVAQLRDQGRKAPLNDSWIAATAIARDLPVMTQDGDFDLMPGIRIIRPASKLRHLPTAVAGQGPAGACRNPLFCPTVTGTSGKVGSRLATRSGKAQRRVVTGSVLTVLAAAIGGCGSSPAMALHPWSAASVSPSAAAPPAPRLTGRQLTAVLLPKQDFPAGYQIDTKLSSDSGATAGSPDSQQQLRGMSCKNFQLTFEGPGFGETAFAQRIIDSPNTTAFFNQTIYQFGSASAAASFFAGVRGVAGTCGSFTSTSNGSPLHEQLRLSTAPRGIRGQAYTIQETRRVVLNGITVNSTAVNLVAVEGTDVYEVTTFSAEGPPPRTPSLAAMTEQLITRLSSSLPLADARAKPSRPAYAHPVLPARRVVPAHRVLSVQSVRATIAALAALIIAGCASPGSPTVHGTNAGAAARPPGTLTAPGTPSAPATVRTDVPEPATAPPLTRTPAGTVVPMPGSPEGLALDAKDGILAVGLRQPDGIALVNVSTGRVRGVVRLPGAPRHLQLAGPQGPVLVPAEQVGRLLEVAIPSGTLIANTKVGRQPHDAAAADGTIFVGNEYSNTVSLVRNGRQVAVEPSPVQPGGVAAALDGSVVVVVGVRGRRIEAYTPGGKPLGTAPCGVGPTHVRAGPHNLFYVADTEGNQVLIYAVTANGPRQVGAVPTVTGTPYGIAVDPVRGIVYVTLTATNTLEAFRIKGQALVPDGQWPTVRQPNDVAVDTATGRVYVAGRDANQLEMLAGP